MKNRLVNLTRGVGVVVFMFPSLGSYTLPVRVSLDLKLFSHTKLSSDVGKSETGGTWLEKTTPDPLYRYAS